MDSTVDVSPRILRGTYAIATTPWSFPDRTVGEPAANCPWNPDPRQAGLQPVFIIEPRAILHCFTFDGEAGVSGKISLNSRRMTSQVDANGQYSVRKNLTLGIIDGFLTIVIPSFKVANDLYFIKRTSDEIDLVLLRSGPFGDPFPDSEGTHQPKKAQLPVLSGTLKRVSTSVWDWYFNGIF